MTEETKVQGEVVDVPMPSQADAENLTPLARMAGIRFEKDGFMVIEVNTRELIEALGYISIAESFLHEKRMMLDFARQKGGVVKPTGNPGIISQKLRKVFGRH